jgi:hypothetical protein
MYKLTKDDRVVLYNKVFGTDEGKIVLENIMEISSLLSTTLGMLAAVNAIFVNLAMSMTLNASGSF